MAKKNIFTSSSKENLQNMLNQLRQQAYYPIADSTIDDSNIVSDLPTEELPEPIMEQESVQDSSYEEEGFFTKLGNKIKDKTGLYIPETDYSGENPFKDASIKTNKEAYKTILDPTFAFGEGWIQNNIDIPSGKMLLNSKEKTDLLYQKEFLETQQEMNDVRIQLNQARLENDSVKIQALAPVYNSLEKAYLSGFDSYRELAGKNEYYQKYGKQNSIQERINAINKRLRELNEEDVELNSDIQSNRQQLHNLQNIYKISPEYKELEQKDWIYQIPRAMGTSAFSMVSNAAVFGVQAGSRWLASQTVAGAGGAYGELIAGGTAILGAAANVAANIWSRDMESLAEVSNNYKSNIQQYAQDNNIDVNEIAKAGRETLRKLTGQEYSEDPNSDQYRTNDEVFEDMLAYDVATNNTDLDRLTATTKKNLQGIYDRNMALVLSDVAQSAMIIPGAGKVFNKALSSLNLPERAVNGTVKALDKAIDYTLAKTASNATKKGISKYIVDPAVRILGSAGLEGLEETTQYVIGSKINEQKEPESTNWYNPFDISKLFIQNQYYGLKSLAAMAGVSGDPALDNDEDLVNNFKVGAVLGLLMGGSFQAISATRNAKSYNAGRELARNTMANYISAKEDVFKYQQYAEKAQNKFFDKDSFIDGLNQQIEQENLPEGYTRQDIETEKENINEIYDIVNNNKVIKQLSSQDRAVGAALIKHYKDEYKKALEANNSVDSELINKIQNDVNSFVEINNIPTEKTNVVNSYLYNKSRYDAFSDYIKTIQNFTDTEYSTKESQEVLDDLIIEQEKIQEQLNSLNDIIKEDNDLKNILNDDSTYATVNQYVKNNAIQKFLQARELRKAKEKYLSILNDKKVLKQSIDKYNESKNQNAQDEILTEKEDIVESPATLDEEIIEDGQTTEQAVPIETPIKQETKIEPKVEQTSQNNEDQQESTVTPEATPSIQTNDEIQEQEEKPSNKINLLEQALTYDTNEDVSEEDQVQDEILNERDFEEETYEKQPDQIYDSSESNEDNNEPISKDDENQIQDINAQQQETPEVQPQTSDVTFDSYKLDRSITDEDVTNTALYEQDNQNDTDLEQNNLIQGTLFYQFSDIPLKKGYESGNALREFVSVPGNIQKAKISAYVEPTDYEYGKYNPDDKSTWDNAAIRIEITSPDGKKYIASLKTIEGAEQLYLANNKVLSDTEKERFRQLRNTIIQAKLVDPDAIISFKNVTISDGIISRTDSNRNLRDIKGLHIPKDLHELHNSGIKFGIGKGIIGNFMIVDENGMPLNGHGGSGKIFIYPKPEDTLNGKQIPIKLNEQRFVDDNGNPNDLARYLAKMFIYRETGDPGLYFEDLANLILHYSESSLIKQDDPRYEFLADKQFYIDYKNGWAQLGRDRLSLNQIRSDAGVERVTNFIANNLHWNTEKSLLWNPLPKSLKEYLIDLNQNKVYIGGGINIDLEDVGLKRVNGQLITDEQHPNGLTTLAWMIKHGILQTNVDDVLFKDPFVYVNDPIITASKPKPKKRNLLLEADFGEQEDITVENKVEEKETTEQKTQEYDPYTDASSDEVLSFFGFDGPEKRMSVKEVEQNKKINTKKATKWLKSKLGLDESQIDIIDGVIRQFANGEAVYGIAHTDGIAISNLAIEGVQYHEAWHRVSLLLLDSDTRNRLYEEFRKQHPLMRTLDNKQLEEAIADSFMDYMLNDKDTKFRYYINKIFRNLKKLIGFNTKLGKASLNQIFDAIKYGDFAKYKLNEESLLDFLNSYKTGAYYKVGPNQDVILKYFPTIHDFESALDSLKSCLFIANGAKYLTDINNLDNTKLKTLLISLSKTNRLTESQKNAIQEIIDNFDIFMYHLQPKLQQMGIKAIEKNADEDFQERENTGIQNYDKAGYEFDKKNNALASVKMFIATLADTYFDENNVLRTKINNITGLPMIVDYDEAYSLILNNLSTVEDYSPVPGEDPNNSLLGKCANLSRHNSFFAFLYKRLNDVKDSNLETQILQTIKSFNQNFVEVAYTTDQKGNSTFAIKDTINKKATKTFPSTWSELFFNSDLIIKKNDSISANTNKIKNILNDYNTLFNSVKKNQNITNSDIRNYINDLVKILNSVSITVDDVTIEGLLDQDNRAESIKQLITTTQSGSLYQLFNGTIKSTLGGNQTYTVKGIQKVRSLDTVFMGLGMNNIINKLSLAQAVTHPDDTNISVLGPNNNIVFTKTLNCYVSDLMRWLNLGDETTLRNLNNDPYCKSSLILQSANNKSFLRLNTFLNFYGDKGNDKGRDYLSISPTEDYIAKMAFTWNNHIIFPTMADKKTWFTISGIQLFNKEMFIQQQDNKLKIQFNREALKYLYKAWEDEYNAIVNYYNTLSSVKAPIKNYHTSGKGGLFRHFTGYYVNRNGKNEWFDLNKEIKNALAFDKKHRSSLMLRTVLEQIREDLFTNPQNTYEKINNNLISELQTELETCENLGIISKDKKNPKQYKNLLLDSSVFDYFKQIYEQNSNKNISANADRYAIMTMIGNHMINQNASTIETEKIITGDVAFYKNDDDKIKRLGAVLSTGDNLRTQWLTNDPNKIQLYKKLNGRNTYTCAIFNDNEIPSAQYDLIKELFEYDNFRNLLLEKLGLTENVVDQELKDLNAAKEKYPEISALAKTLSEEDAGAYGLNSKKTKGNINQADAAVYIRPEMYQQIVRRLGEWSTEVEEAFNILESDTDWLSDPKLYAKSLKTLIKALKTTYFGYTYNADLGYNVPIFNKMAMFPMFKAIATGDNREIYDRMNAIGKYKDLQPIDQIAFESAVKVGIEGGFSFYSDYTNNSINDLSKIHTTTQYFRNLRRQLITDPHTHDRTLFGTQVSTVAVSNLVMDRVYGDENNPESQRTGQQLKDQLFGTINAISNKGMQKVRDMFMTDGELDFEKTSQALIKEARSSGMGKNIEDALVYNKDKKDFEVSLAALPDSKWAETKVVSNINKKAIDLELPGGAFIQMSSFGFKSIKTVGSNAVAGGKRLVNINPDGSMDAIISINLFRHVIPNFDKLSFTEAKKWLIDAGIIYDPQNPDKAKPMAIGYRIPTQGLSSIAGIRIKDVLPSNVGDMIILPDEFTTQTGSDFDIDKLYIARYNYDKDGKKIEFKGLQKVLNEHNELVDESFEAYLHRRFIEEQGTGSYEESERGKDAVQQLYDSWLKSIGNPTNVYEANSREANENLLLDTYMTVLTDKKTVDQTRLPLDKVTGIIKDEILPIVDGVRESKGVIPFKELSPTYQMNKKYEYSGGKTGIGPFALNNKNHILTQLANLKFKENSLLKALGFIGLNGIKSKNEIVYKRDKNGKIIYENGKPKSFIEEGIRILDWISAMINAHVDVAKDPYVIRLNVRQYTYNICNFLLRVGYGKSTFYFLPQQILKDMAVAYDAAAGNYGVDSDSSKTKIVNDQIKKIRIKYYKKYLEACKNGNINIELQQDKDTGSITYTDMAQTITNNASTLLNRDNLIDLLQKDKILDKLSYEELADYYKQQLLLSEVFIQLNDLAQDMSKLVQLSQIDTKRYGNNFIEQDRFLYRLKSLIANTTLFNSDDIVKYYKTTFLFTKLVNGIVEPANIFEPLLLRGNKSFKDAITKVLSMVNRVDTNDESLNKTISNELEGSLRYQFLATKNVDVYDMLYGENNMASRLAKIKTDILNNMYEGMLTQDGKIANKLLNYLGTLTKMSTDKYFAPNIITKNRISDGDKYLKQTLSTYWEELLDSPYEEIRKFAEDLFYYQLATTAGNFTKNGIFGLTPIKLIKESGYNDFMRNQVNNFIGDSSLDYDNFFLNNWNNNKLVKNISLYKEKYDRESGETVKDLQYPVLFSEDKLESINKIYPLIIYPNFNPIGRNSIKQNIYQPYIKVVLDNTNPAGTILYKYIGYVTNDKNIEKPVYVIVNKKGLNNQGRVVKEYDSYSNSLFDFNNVNTALNAKQIITHGDIEHLISKGRSKDRERWSKLINNITTIQDYIPQTKALNMDLFQYDVAENVKVEEPIKVTSIPEQPITLPVKEIANVVNNSYTFSDGFTVDLPFTLNEQQMQLLHTLEDFIINPKSYDNSITIAGYAGTGKTTMISIFNKWLTHKLIDVVFSSPTHRANAVTKMNNPAANVKTLHSIFGLSPIIDLENGVYDLRKLTAQQINKPKLAYDQLLIIDEASMVSESLYKFIETFKKDYDLKVIYVGDPAQLSPVKDKDISPVFRNTKSKQELTKVERTGDNPILFEATNLREGKDLSYTTNIINGEGVEYIPTNSSRIDEVINNIIDSQEYKSNPLYFRILSATNQQLTEANNKVRKQLFGDNAKQIEVGEILMGYDNLGRDENSIRNSIDYIVTSVSEKKEKEINAYNSRITVTGYEITLKVAATDEKIDNKYFVLANETSISDLNKIAKFGEEIQKAISYAFKNHDYDLLPMFNGMYNTFKNNTISMRNLEQNGRLVFRKALDYGYAHTIHKSQGGTYNKVMIYLDTIGVFDPKVQQQLKYVGVSRAKENVYIITNHEIIEQKHDDININNVESTNNDTINFNNKSQSKIIISSNKTILTNEELKLIKPYSGSNPRIAVASEHTDPVFFSKKIIDILDGKDSVEDKFRKLTYSGKDFAALYLITKHDGLPLKKLLEYKIPKLIHFSITGLGGTKYEPGVMKPDDLLDRIAKFIKQGLDPNMVTVRIDPIIPGVTSQKVIENIIKRSSEIGIKNIRFSVMDQYSTTKHFMQQLGYDYSKYYDGNSLHAKKNVIESIENIMVTLAKKYNVRLSTCAEPFNIEGISKEACLSVSAINNMLGTSIPETMTGKQRALCSCYGGKTDLLKYNNKCASSCVYCYAHHNANSNAIYYNEDGSLKDTILTRTNDDFEIENNKPNNKISRATTGYSRQSAISNPRTLYIFTDNTDRTSGGTQINDGWYKDKYGNGGYGSDRNPTTAVIRGLDNAAPISIMKYFYRNHKNMTVFEARWTDKDLNDFKKVIDDEINDIKLLWDSGDFDNIIVPQGDGFFNSKIANINKERTPKLYQYLHDKLVELNNYVNNVKVSTEEIVQEQPKPRKHTGNLLYQADFSESEFTEMKREGKNIESICKDRQV